MPRPSTVNATSRFSQLLDAHRLQNRRLFGRSHDPPRSRWTATIAGALVTGTSFLWDGRKCLRAPWARDGSQFATLRDVVHALVLVIYPIPSASSSPTSTTNDTAEWNIWTYLSLLQISDISHPAPRFPTPPPTPPRHHGLCLCEHRCSIPALGRFGPPQPS